MTVLQEALWLGIIVGVTNFVHNRIITRTQTNSPLVICPLVGLVFGDVHQGMIIGAALALLFIGSFSVGNALPPEQSVASALACAFAIKMGYGAEVALGIAMPIAVFVGVLQNLFSSLMSIPTRMIDTAAAEGNTKRITIIFLVSGFIFTFVLFGVTTTVTYALGIDLVEAAIARIPQFVMDGMSVAAGIIPAVGIGLLLKMVYKGYLVPYFFLGYVLAAYLGVPILGIVILGVIFVLIKMDFRSRTAQTVNGQEVDEDDF